VTAQRPLRGDVAVLVPAAGSGSRLGPGEPKALRELGGAWLLVHAIRRIGAAPSVGCVVVAAPVGRVAEVRAALAAETPPHLDLRVDEGGPTRRESVLAALIAMPPGYAVVLVHDAARAFAPTDLIERVAAAVRDGHDAVVPVLPMVDTVKQVDPGGYVVRTVDRSDLRSVQTPQGFRVEVLRAAHDAADRMAVPDGAAPATDDAGLVERVGGRVFCVAGAEEAAKITHPADLARAELAIPPAGRTLLR
jgi:2-C-methyl-D-erythritol 4-phosphate cytidylyltransferase